MELTTLQSTIQTLEAEVEQEQHSIDFLSRSVNALEVNGNRTRHMRTKQIDGTYGGGVGDPKFLSNTDHVLRNFLIDGCFKIMVYRIQFLPL